MGAGAQKKVSGTKYGIWFLTPFPPLLLPCEVALPHRVRVNLQELIPRPFASLRAWIKTVLFQDVLGRLPRNLEAELPKFPENACVAPRVLLGQLEDNFLDVVRRLWRDGLPGGGPLPCLLRRGIANPRQK